jgi:hypothetical protein
MVAAGETLLTEAMHTTGHGTFGGMESQQKAQASGFRYSRVALAVAAFAVIAIVAVAGHGMFNRPVELMDDVSHDAAVHTIVSHEGNRQGNKQLNAHSSIEDFFSAAMRGDFEKKGNVKLATNGLFEGKATDSTPKAASYQSLASRRMKPKAVHRVHTQHAKAVVHDTKAHTLRAKKLPGGIILHQTSKGLHGVSENHWKFPTEDKFVARYTGALPKGDVMVDSFTSGPYVPI